jgi:putative MATE family efflux protein
MEQQRKSYFRMIFKIALPMILQGIVSYALVFIDTAFLGHYKLESLSAVNNAATPFFMMQSFFEALGIGISIMIAHRMGAGCRLQAQRTTETAIFFNQIIAIGYFIFWQIAARPFMILLGAEGEILNGAVDYVTVLSWAFLSYGVAMTLGSAFSALGKTFPIMVASIIKSVLNIFLDWVLIFGNLGFPEMGVKGAALATVLSIYIGNAVFIVMALRNKIFKIRLKGIFRPVGRVYRKIFTLGLPAGIDFILWTVGQTVIISMLNRWDRLAAGYYGIFNVIINFSLHLYMGIGDASISLIGRATGARDSREAYRIGNYALLYTFIICGAVGFLFLLIPHEIISMFTKDGNVVHLLAQYLFWCILILLPKSMNIIGGCAIQGTGDTKWKMYNQIAGTVIIIPMVYVTMFVLDWGLAGLLFSVFFDELWRGILNYFRFRKIKTLLIKNGK